jgi:hypothetical protein
MHIEVLHSTTLGNEAGPSASLLIGTKDIPVTFIRVSNHKAYVCNCFTFVFTEDSRLWQKVSYEFAPKTIYPAK